MDIQYISVIAIILAAVGYVGATLRKRSRSFSPKAGCGDDCDCNGNSKKLIS
jgi:hypothetical protein